VRQDCARLWVRIEALRGRGLPGPGLYHYRSAHPGRQHLHLRIHPDRTALLFVNAVEVIHLSPTDGELAWLILERLPRAQALALLQAVYPHTPPDELAAGLERVYRLIELAEEQGGDLHCCRLQIPQPPALAVRAQAPFKADLALHYACNNRCSHCYNEPGRRGMPSLDAESWREVLDRLWRIGVPYVIFTGGDPTVHPRLVALIEHAAALGMVTGVNTNGRRLAEPGFAEALTQAGLDHVQITLASPRPEVHDRIVGCAGAFAQTLRGLHRALECGLHTLTNTTLTRENSAEAVQLVEFLHAQGVRTFAMNAMIHSGCGTGHPATLGASEAAPVLDAVRERARALDMRFLWYSPTRYCLFSPVQAGLGLRTCNAAEYSICIEPNGDVLPCQSWYQPTGNILRDRWGDIWDSDLFRRIRHRREHPPQAGLPAECWDCPQLRPCGGGCLLELPVHSDEVIPA